MNARLLGALKGEARENRKNEILSAKNVLDILSEIVYNMLRDEERVAATDYSNPSWSHLQAHQNGRREALRSIANLLNVDGGNN